MSTNTDRAAAILHRHHDNCNDAAAALDAAGVLAPDLPKPSRGGIWAGKGVWVISAFQGGACVHVDDDLTPEEMRRLAYALLAAADYSKEEQ